MSRVLTNHNRVFGHYGITRVHCLRPRGRASDTVQSDLESKLMFSRAIRRIVTWSGLRQEKIVFIVTECVDACVHHLE